MDHRPRLAIGDGERSRSIDEGMAEPGIPAQRTAATDRDGDSAGSGAAAPRRQGRSAGAATRFRQRWVLVLFAAGVLGAALAGALLADPGRWDWLGFVSSSLLGGEEPFALQPAPAQLGGSAAELGAGLRSDPGTAGRQAAALVDRARLAAATGHVLEPPGDNAVALFRQALALEPGNAAATAGLEGLARDLLLRAEAALARADFDAAGQRLAQARAVAPDLADHARVERAIVAGRADAAAARARETRIARHLEAAAQAHEQDRLDGEADSALAHYRAVLAIAPHDARALAGLTAIVDAHLARAEAALERGAIDAAGAALGAAAAIRPEAAGVVDLRRRLDRDHGARAAAERRQRIDALLAQARADLLALRLTAPPGDNAVSRYRQVLELDPASAEARQGLVQVAERYAQLSVQARERGDAAAAGLYLSEARKLAPRNDSVTAAAAALAPVREPRVAPGAARQQRVSVARIAVLYDGFQARYRRFGLTEEQVRQRVEERLARAGYQVLPVDRARKAGDARLMQVSLRADRGESKDSFTCTTTVSVREAVTVAGGAVQFAPQPVWTRSDRGGMRAGELRRIYDWIDALVEQYLRESPAGAG